MTDYTKITDFQHITGYGIKNAFFNNGFSIYIIEDNKFKDVVALPDEYLIMTETYKVYVDENDKVINIFTNSYKEPKYKAGDFLYGIPSSPESEKYNPEDKRVFIYTGQKNADGYGILIGYEDGKLVHSSGHGNFQWGASVRYATADEISKFMQDVMNTESIKWR